MTMTMRDDDKGDDNDDEMTIKAMTMTRETMTMTMTRKTMAMTMTRNDNGDDR